MFLCYTFYNEFNRANSLQIGVVSVKFNYHDFRKVWVYEIHWFEQFQIVVVEDVCSSGSSIQTWCMHDGEWQENIVREGSQCDYSLPQ